MDYGGAASISPMPSVGRKDFADNAIAEKGL
jgi:hypothetical protein